MIQVNDVTLRFGKRTLFEGVNIKFTKGNCYGLIGANGAGKSTFLKLLSGELETTHGEIEITPELEADLRDYVASDDFYPKRYKVHSRQYFIVIKTEAESLQDFKDKKAVRQPVAGVNDSKTQEQKRLQAILPGWYEGTLDFKRVVVNHLGKCEYRDTTFTAQCKAESIQDCYNRICEYLLTCVDKRSQFPAARGKNFHCQYLGAEKPLS